MSAILALLALLPQVLALAGGPGRRHPHLPRHDLETDTMITLAGYTAETHKVITPDGYVLTVHRIVGSGPAVFMQHGLEDSSSTWVLSGPELGSPAFRLADQGYDVWLGNFRGNHYSREHRTLDPDRDSDFWKFSWDEMALLDLPTQLGLVLDTTDRDKIYYIGHSMGTTTFMALNSVDPSWADRVELAVLLAPAAYMDHMESPITLIAPFADMVQWIADHLGVGEFLPSNWFMDWLADFACPPDSALEIVCENIVFLLAGYDEPQMNKTMLPSIASHLPSGTSTYTVLQYAQSYKHKTFGGMDWGSAESNLRHHGSAAPPLYDLRNIKTKIALFSGDNDWLVAEKDLERILEQVPTIVEHYRVPWHGWNHFDFLYAIDIDKYQNEHLIQLLAQHKIN